MIELVLRRHHLKQLSYLLYHPAVRGIRSVGIVVEQPTTDELILLGKVKGGARLLSVGVCGITRTEFDQQYARWRRSVSGAQFYWSPDTPPYPVPNGSSSSNDSSPMPNGSAASPVAGGDWAASSLDGGMK